MDVPPLRTLAQRLQPQSPWGNRAILGVLLIAVSVGTASVMSPGLYRQPVPELKREDVGHPFRSGTAYRADRDYEIVNQGLTEQRRQEARAAVRPVYDFNPSVLTDLKSQAREAFALMQEIKAQSDAVEKSAQSASEAVEKDKVRRRNPTPSESSELQDALRDERGDFEEKLFGQTDSPLEAEDFQALLNARFAPEVEQAVQSLLETAYTEPVAGSREELAREGSQGISLRDLRDGTEQPRSAASPAVVDVREAQGELDRFALISGNVLPDRPVSLRRAALRIAKRMLRPNLTINTAETGSRRRRAAQEVNDSVISIRKSQKVISDGELINETHLVILDGIRAQTHTQDLRQMQLGAVALVALLIAVTYAFFRTAFRRFRPMRKDALLLGTLLVGMLGLLHLSVGVADAVHDRYNGLPAEGLYFCIPMAAGAALARFLLSEEMALLLALLLACLSGVLLGNSLTFGIYTLLSSLMAAERIAKARDRMSIFKAGLATGAVNLTTVVMLAMGEGKGINADTAVSAAFAFLGTAIFVPALVMALMPLIEVGFGYASDLKLLELANLNHPALKELIVQAPGTYHHSIILGSLVENAAEAIGANPLLARSCAYYHDIGKGRNPLYFGENQKGENRHDALAPAMSAVIIKRHVTEGIEMARQYRLPKLVADAIPQHHGTRLVGYFYHKAVKEQEGKENQQVIDEESYRYPGPKPQFRESALVMVADAVEASCRAITDPTSPKLQAQVQKIINVIFAEGQLDECDLTLKDLNLIAQSFLHTLEGIYHARPSYPPAAVGGQRPGTLSQEPVRVTLAVATGPKVDAKRSAGA